MRVITGLSIAMFLVMTACLSEKSVSKKYYVIGKSYEQVNSASEAFNAIPGRCEIEQVKISPVYAGNQIVNRSDSHEVTYYGYHMWAVRPSLTITEVILEYFENSGIFASVSSRYSRAIPDYRLVTFIHHMEVVENKNEFSAHFHIEFRILHRSEDRVLVQHEADRTETLSGKDLNLFTSAISNMLTAELQNFTRKIDSQRSAFELENQNN
jgi:ABC-type uncharacterized transport system auxiliary subunit